jgi:cysteine-rich repeat protein
MKRLQICALLTAATTACDPGQSVSGPSVTIALPVAAKYPQVIRRGELTAEFDLVARATKGVIFSGESLTVEEGSASSTIVVPVGSYEVTARLRITEPFAEISGDVDVIENGVSDVVWANRYTDLDIDSDGDGKSDLEELSSGADPTTGCGNGVVETDAGEECDGGFADTADCDYDDGSSAHACTSANCGDGYVNTAAGESCDDGWEDTVNCDYDDGVSDHACTLMECGDGYRNEAAGETCDDGNTDACVGDCSADCSTTVTVTGCGDGITCGTEDCDDAGESASCDNDCTPALCGDGTTNGTAGESCDDGDMDNSDSCPDGVGGTCQPASCGDGHIWSTEGGGELCDDGPGDTAACDYDNGASGHACTVPQCGDGYVNLAAGETCDDGDQDNSDSCPDGVGGTCQQALCGDGHLWNTDGGTESCDDGDGGNYDNCPDGPAGTCQVAFCGDGHLWNADGGTESCDDGNLQWNDACHPWCFLQSPFGTPGALNSNAASDSGGDRKPDLATDGAGNWVAVWGSDDDLGGTLGSDGDILFSRSSDNGHTWTAVHAVNTNADADSGGDSNPRIATDRTGNWMAVWSSTEDLGGTIGSDYDVFFALSADNGATWSPLDAVNNDAGADANQDYEPAILFDGSGWLVVWRREEEPVYNVFSARSEDDGATWTTPARVNTDSGNYENMSPQVATDGSGNLVAVWHRQTMGNNYVVAARSSNDGGQWTAPEVVSDTADAYNEQEAHVATDGTGTWLASWIRIPGVGRVDIAVVRSEDNGATWTSPAIVSDDGESFSGCASDQRSRVVSDASAGWFVVWSTCKDYSGILSDDFDVVVIHSSDNGATWGPIVPLSAYADVDTGGDHHPVLVGDGAGSYVAAWTSNDSLGGTLGIDQDIVFASFPLSVPRHGGPP